MLRTAPHRHRKTRRRARSPGTHESAHGSSDGSPAGAARRISAAPGGRARSCARRWTRARRVGAPPERASVAGRGSRTDVAGRATVVRRSPPPALAGAIRRDGSDPDRPGAPPNPGGTFGSRGRTSSGPTVRVVVGSLSTPGFRRSEPSKMRCESPGWISGVTFPPPVVAPGRSAMSLFCGAAWVFGTKYVFPPPGTRAIGRKGSET